jgi:hypothetical protein
MCGLALAGQNTDSYVFRDADVTWMFGRGMPASRLQKLQSQYGAEFVWARRGVRTYVIRDAAVIEQARTAVAPHRTREEQQQRLEKIVDAAIQRGVARMIE